MSEFVATIPSDACGLAASIALPDRSPPRAGLVCLHGANQPSRDWYLYRHLAGVLPPQGVAVVRFDRRPSAGEVPYESQAADALSALRTLRGAIAIPAAPIGLWGVSQGAWPACIAAANSDEVAFLVLVSASGVSPAQQMRYGCARQLRDAGFGGADLEELAQLREAFEAFQRGTRARDDAQSVVDRLVTRPWFPLVYIPQRLGAPGSWHDMDFDPVPVFAQVRCPVLLFYGGDDDWVPIDESLAAWRAAGTADVTVVRVPGTMHIPTLGGESIEDVSLVYTEKLILWLQERID